MTYHHLTLPIGCYVECHYRPGSPGRISGPPELCEPPEPAEVEIISVTVTDGAVFSELLPLGEEVSDGDELDWPALVARNVDVDSLEESIIVAIEEAADDVAADVGLDRQWEKANEL